MKVRLFLLLLIAIVLVFSCSCQPRHIIQSDTTDDIIIEQPEPQYMAYHLGEACRLGDDIYFVNCASFTDSQIFATEYGSENFDIFVPCFDAVCDHWDRSKCCITTFQMGISDLNITAFDYNGEPAVLLFNPLDLALSMPYSNVKIDLFCEDFAENELSVAIPAYREWSKSESKAVRSEPLVYGDYLYYVELKSGVRTQYRISVSGGEPERVFDEDNIIIRTIINDRFYGIRYDSDIGEKIDIKYDQDKMHYFRSDMNYENVEPLPEVLDYFQLQCDGMLFATNSNAIICADSEFIYVLDDMKIWKIPDSDIYAEPILIVDMEGIIPKKQSADIWQELLYNDGVLYILSHEGLYERDLLSYFGTPLERPAQWYESSTLYCFDVITGECRSFDISNENYFITEILYADGEYLYGKGRYVHHDNRSDMGYSMRLTIDTMRYEVILPDRFLEYSAETTAS